MGEGTQEAQAEPLNAGVEVLETFLPEANRRHGGIPGV